MLEAYQRLKLAMVIATSKAPQFADLMTHRNAGGTSFSAILALIALYIMITLNAKRLHDLGKLDARHRGCRLPDGHRRIWDDVQFPSMATLRLVALPRIARVFALGDFGSSSRSGSLRASPAAILSARAHWATQ